MKMEMATGNGIAKSWCFPCNGMASTLISCLACMLTMHIIADQMVNCGKLSNSIELYGTVCSINNRGLFEQALNIYAFQFNIW